MTHPTSVAQNTRPKAKTRIAFLAS